MIRSFSLAVVKRKYKSSRTWMYYYSWTAAAAALVCSTTTSSRTLVSSSSTSLFPLVTAFSPSISLVSPHLQRNYQQRLQLQQQQTQTQPQYFPTSLNSQHKLFMSASSGTNIPDTSISKNLKTVLDKIAIAQAEDQTQQVQLVAVSKTKPLESIQAAYAAGQCVFGENYVQELVEKAQAMHEQHHADDIVWHFIGRLQSNKVKLVLSVATYGRLVVETVSTEKVARKLANAWQQQQQKQVDGKKEEEKKLGIYVQVNVSGEDTKSGVSSREETLELCRLIVDGEDDDSSLKDSLELLGLMTIGAPGDVEGFDRLREIRDYVQEELKLSNLGLSMGMSGDYEVAISKGATNVRVGSTIFGERDYSNKT